MQLHPKLFFYLINVFNENSELSVVQILIKLYLLDKTIKNVCEWETSARCSRSRFLVPESSSFFLHLIAFADNSCLTMDWMSSKL